MLEWLLHLDNIIFTQINSVWNHPWTDSFFPFITDLHKNFGFKYIFTPLVIIFFMSRRGIKNGFVIFIFSILAISLADGIGNHGFKKTFQRPRPFENAELHVIQRSPAGGYSFVSNHSTNNFAFATTVSAFFPPVRILLFTIAVLVSYSRIYNGVHYPSDVLCGAVIGILSGLAMIYACRKTLQKLNEKKEVPS